MRHSEGRSRGCSLAAGSTGVAANNGGYGPLRPVPDLTDGVVRLHLPEGFAYRSFTPTGTLMSDGVITPGRHDGMAAFPWGRGRYRRVRNHEVNGPTPAFGSPEKAYDRMAGGGTTTLEVNRHASEVDSWVSCNGTQMNCAGGATPWGTWITCEETSTVRTSGRTSQALTTSCCSASTATSSRSP